MDIENNSLLQLSGASNNIERKPCEGSSISALNTSLMSKYKKSDKVTMQGSSINKLNTLAP